jgi:thiamine-phosphate pyrophosphorylase
LIFVFHPLNGKQKRKIYLCDLCASVVNNSCLHPHEKHDRNAKYYVFGGVPLIMKKIGKLHLLTDIVVQSRFSHLELTTQGIRGGADVIQFRQKTGSTRELIDIARQMQTICREAGVPLIVNDRLDVALAIDADGVHLGQDDFPIDLARKLLGAGKIIGGSASNLEEARKCWHQGADYIGLGPIYTTSSKDDAGPVCGLDLLKKVAGQIPLPIIAIGGIQAENIEELLAAGAYGVAIISAICCRPDPAAATRAIRARLMNR